MEDGLKSAIENAKNISRRNTAKYGCILNGTDYVDYRETACHRVIVHGHNSVLEAGQAEQITHLCTHTQNARGKSSPEKEGIEFYTWLLGPDSPYRALGVDINDDPEFAWKYGIAIDPHGKSARLLHHFFVATRAATEVGATKGWSTWRAKGLHPVMALIPAYDYSFGGVSNSHSFWPRSVDLTEDWLKNFAAGTPKRLRDYWKPDRVSGPQYPINPIWGDLHAYDYDSGPVEIAPGYERGYPRLESFWDELARLFPDCFKMRDHQMYLRRLGASIWDGDELITVGQIAEVLRDKQLELLINEGERLGLQ